MTYAKTLPVWEVQLIPSYSLFTHLRDVFWFRSGTTGVFLFKRAQEERLYKHKLNSFYINAQRGKGFVNACLKARMHKRELAHEG